MPRRVSPTASNMDWARRSASRPTNSTPEARWASKDSPRRNGSCSATARCGDSRLFDAYPFRVSWRAQQRHPHGEEVMKIRSALRAAAIGAAFATVATASFAGDFINVLTGGTSGVYYPLGVALSQIYGKALPNAKTSVQATKASAENL